ncbi:MAG: type II toxin-antitoxin system VapC family toxin, partial [Planctomycetaceae bacterium]
VLDAFADLTFAVTSSEQLWEDAYQLAVAHQRSVYDSLYLALSAREQCSFVTADERLANAVGGAFPSLVRVPDWP